MNGIGELPTLVVAHVARGRTDEPGDGVLLHVLAHVKTQELHAHRRSQLAGQLGLAHPRGAGKKKTAHRLVGLGQPRARQANGAHHLFDGLVLAVDHQAYVAIKGFESTSVVHVHGARGHTGHPRNDFLHVAHGHSSHAALPALAQLDVGTRFVEHVDGLVGQQAVGDITGR